MSDDQDHSDIKDGFDLLEFPCDYSFKAMCRVMQDGKPAKQIVQALVGRHVSAEQIINIRSTLSRTGKFESVTVTVHLQERAMLELIYQAFADSDDIVMSL